MLYFIGFIGSLTGFLFGYDEGIIAGSLGLIKHTFLMSNRTVAFFAAALPFGALLGALFSGGLITFSRRMVIGRRGFLMISAALFLGGAILGALSTSVFVLTSSRFILGVAIGIGSVTAPLYLSECAPAHMRGAFVALYQLAITLGILSAYIANYVFYNDHAWQLMFISSAIPALVLLIGILYLPDSPRWLVTKEQFAKARLVLQKLRGGENVDNEINSIVKTIQNEPSQAGLVELLDPRMRSVIFLGIILFSLQQLSGINVIISYAPEIFRLLHFSDTYGRILATVGIGVVNVLVTFIAIIYVDKIGRRQLLIFGFMGASVSLALLSIFSMFEISFAGFVSVVCLMVYILSFAISIGPIPHVMVSEIYPLHVRGVGMGMALMSNWLFNTCTVWSFPILSEALSIHVVFSIYAFISLIGAMFSYRCLPETSGLSLETIEEQIMQGHSLRMIGRMEHHELADSTHTFFDASMARRTAT